MMKNSYLFLISILIFQVGHFYSQANLSFDKVGTSIISKLGFTDAADFGFSPDASAVENKKSLQKAIDQTGTVVISKPGIYEMSGTVYIGSNTSLVCGNGVFLKKVNDEGGFTHVILNKGALTKQFDHNISIEGLQIIVNGIDVNFTDVFGLRGHLAFFYIKDLRIERFRCMDVARGQFCIHVCTFEDVIIDDVIIKGWKDGIHLGKGSRFTIRNGVFETGDDAIALNAHDYATSNPELGWIENGLIENCYDLDKDKNSGFFCRVLAGAWIDWKEGMEVQQSDAAVSGGIIYRVQGVANGPTRKSMKRPTHKNGNQVIDGITWRAVQEDVVYTAGVRNVIFRDIFLEKPRTAFSIHFDNDGHSRSYYPGAEIPKQEHLFFDNIRIKHDQLKDFISITTPIDVVTIINSSIQNNKIGFYDNSGLPDFLETKINMIGCVFNKEGDMELLANRVKSKKIFLNTSSSIELHDSFSANVNAGSGKIIIESDLSGLKTK